jgi:hypothetical protein
MSADADLIPVSEHVLRHRLIVDKDPRARPEVPKHKAVPGLDDFCVLSRDLRTVQDQRVAVAATDGETIFTQGQDTGPTGLVRNFKPCPCHCRMDRIIPARWGESGRCRALR